MMDMLLLGTCHDDPLGRSRTRAAFETAIRERSSRPQFVGVEWAYRVFDALREQRGRLQNIIHATWPWLAEETLATLASSLAFEGDAHRDDADQTNTIWLDEGRRDAADCEDVAIKHEAVRKACRYLALLRSDEMPVDPEAVCRMLSERSWDAAGGGGVGFVDKERDELWFSKVSAKLQSEEGWACCIVGASHTRNADGALRHLLIQAGVTCDVKIMNYT